MRIYYLLFCSLLAFSNNAQKITETTTIIAHPNPALAVQKANNNLDAIAFNNQYYLAFRTAPSHFASKKTRLIILKTNNLKDYTIDTTLCIGNDIREPRFALKGDSLFLYYFEGGSKKLKFEPKKIWALVKTPSSAWTAPIDQQLDGYVPWRVRNINGTFYLSAYYGVNLYNKGHHSDLRLFTSDDGLQWKPFTDTAQCNLDFAEEGEFIDDSKGELWGTIRFEGFGGALFHAEKNNWAKWVFYRTDYKYDSALLFNEGDDTYLIARRNIDGKANRFKSRNRNLIRYSFTRKCTSLYKINKENKRIDLVLDFPSTGDNAYAGIVQIGVKEYAVFNYSSNPKHPKNWIRGQLGKTNIYMHRLKF